MDYKAPSTECSTKGCRRQRRPKQRTCEVCHRLYMQGWRKGQREKREELKRLLRAAGL